MLGDRQLKVEDYLAILRRRYWWILLPSLIFPLLAFVACLVLPPRYTSKALVLVAQQKMPDIFVKPVDNDELNSHLATMEEQILSRSALEPIIERFHLFRSHIGKLSKEEQVDKMRDSISVSALRSDFGTRAGGLPGFYLSFEAENPRLAQQVCGDVLSMFMQENVRAREQTAQGTSDFLSKQLDDTKRKLDQQDAQLAAFQSRYSGQLPGQQQANLNTLASLRARLDTANQTLTRAQRDKAYTESMIAQELATWRASQSSGTNTDDLRIQLDKLQDQLVTLQSQYTADHPDVVRLKGEIDRLRQKLEVQPSGQQNLPDPDPDSSATLPPTVRQLRLQVHQLDASVHEAAKEQDDLSKQIKVYEARVQLSPVVEEQYKALTRDHQATLDLYNDLLTKRAQAVMAVDLGRQQRMEQFRVLEPPNLPEKPTWPKRRKVVLAGFTGGLGLSIGFAFLLELRDKRLRTDDDVSFYLQLPVLCHVSSFRATHPDSSHFHSRVVRDRDIPLSGRARI